MGKAVKFGVRHLFIEAHALPGLDQAAVGGGVGVGVAERHLTGAPDLQTARPVELEWLPRPFCSYPTHPLHPDLA